MSKYMEKIFANMDKVTVVKAKDTIKKHCKSFEKCSCGFCINYVGIRKKYFQSCAGKCRVKAY